jgi:hypothetical protein
MFVYHQGSYYNLASFLDITVLQGRDTDTWSVVGKRQCGEIKEYIQLSTVCSDEEGARQKLHSMMSDVLSPSSLEENFFSSCGR